MTENFEVHHWEGDEYIITLNGKPIGSTMHKTEAYQVLRWIKSAIHEIKQALQQ